MASLAMIKHPAAIVALALLTALPARAETKGPVTDDNGVVEIPEGEPLMIGSFLALTGADAALGIDARRGIEIALDRVGATYKGHPIEISFEDETCSPEGGQTAATRLASNDQLVAILGPSCSGAARAGVPILWQHKFPVVGVGPTSPTLTDPARGPDFVGFVRVSFNDNATGKFAASYALKGAKTAATLHDGSTYGQQIVRTFEAEFKAQGGTIVAEEAVGPTDTDLRPVLTRIGTKKPDLLFAPLYVAAGAYLVRQREEVDGLKNTKLLATDPIMAPAFMTAAGKAAVDVKMVGIDFRPETLGPAYQKFVETYKSKYGEAPIAGFHAYGYDALGVLMAAIDKVAVEKDGELFIGRDALNKAIHATAGYEGLTGKLTCDHLGDCASPVYAVWQFTSGDAASYSLGTNPKRVD
ncbi:MULTISPECIES: branched-chain amino acid ABC transporter substrate-binding protein [unclassified Mesorhizobium]|uniref:branched-chain amino acid ABC transporter substrate-binding protein n=1 Tax=unclassified Mesorhizobium TaxID=325217 RepID=UPI001FDEAA4A|nr:MULTISPECIES: branched-chain amino acid ABC transporter substrate-binding protein [unclassified Mesorhizobium]